MKAIRVSEGLGRVVAGLEGDVADAAIARLEEPLREAHSRPREYAMRRLAPLSLQGSSELRRRRSQRVRQFSQSIRCESLEFAGVRREREELVEMRPPRFQFLVQRGKPVERNPRVPARVVPRFDELAHSVQGRIADPCRRQRDMRASEAANEMGRVKRCGAPRHEEATAARAVADRDRFDVSRRKHDHAAGRQAKAT